MSTTSRHLIRSTVLSGAVAAACAAVALLPAHGHAAGGKTQTLRFLDHPVAMKVTHANGTVVTKEPLPEPVAGDVLDIVAVEYAGTHVKHAKKPSGTNHLRCVFAKACPPACVSHVALGSSMLVFEGYPGKLVLGTGRYLGATGRVLSNTTVGDTNDSDIVARITLR